MSLAIDRDKVTAVLLPDGWHRVEWFSPQPSHPRISSFEIAEYEYISSTGYEPVTFHPESQPALVCTGATWTERVNGEVLVVSCPMTSVLAVRTGDKPETRPPAAANGSQ